MTDTELPGAIAKLVARHSRRHFLSIKKYRGKLCAYCRNPMLGRGNASDAPSRDHRFPMSRGGWDVRWNTVVCCRACNERKGHLDEEEYAAVLVDIASNLSGWWSRQFLIKSTRLLYCRGPKQLPRSEILWAWWRKRLFVEDGVRHKETFFQAYDNDEG